MTHALGVSDHIKDRMRKLRGDVRIYKDLQPERTALVIIDMQTAFLEPGGVIEVPASRGIVAQHQPRGAVAAASSGCR